MDLSLRNNDSENEEEQSEEAEDKRRLERLEREKWMQGNLKVIYFKGLYLEILLILWPLFAFRAFLIEFSF